MSCNQERMVMNLANKRTGNPIFIYMLHHVSTDKIVAADIPLVDSAVIALIDMGEVRIMKDASVIHGHRISSATK